MTLLKRIGRWVLIAAVVYGGGWLILSAAYWNKALPGVRAGQLNLAGHSQADITERITQQAGTIKELHFRAGSEVFTVSADDIDLQYDAKASAAAALRSGRQGLGWLVGPYRALVSGYDVPLVLSFKDGALKEELTSQTKGFGKVLKNADIVRRGTSFEIVPEQSGLLVDPDGNAAAARRSLEKLDPEVILFVRNQEPQIYARDLASVRAEANRVAAGPFLVRAGDRNYRLGPDTLGPWITFNITSQSLGGPLLDQADLLRTFERSAQPETAEADVIASRSYTLAMSADREKVGQYVLQVAGEADHPPVNARLAFTNGQLVVSGQPKDGQVVDRPAAVRLITEAIEQRGQAAELPVVTKPADIRQETLPLLGITSQIGSATTTFGGSPPNRIYNIGVGATRFDGVLIKPGEEFSFNGVLGDVGPETGYRPELVIKENKTVPEYGGGLCQVSTTMFRAVLSAGLPVTARTNHAYAVHYYAPIGMDATIYPPNPDMRFRNNTKGHILVQTRQAGTSLTFDFFGTPDGRKASSQIISINATEEGGGTASFRYLVEGGPDPIDRIFYSSYKPRRDFPTSRSLN